MGLLSGGKQFKTPEDGTLEGTLEPWFLETLNLRLQTTGISEAVS